LREVSIIRIEPSRVAAAVLHYLADILLAPTLGATIDGRGVDVIYPKVESVFDDGDGDGFVVGFLESSLASEAEDADLVSRLSKIAGWHGSRGRSVGGKWSRSGTGLATRDLRKSR
jgi:hypothetical protein